MENADNITECITVWDAFSGTNFQIRRTTFEGRNEIDYLQKYIKIIGLALWQHLQLLLRHIMDTCTDMLIPPLYPAAYC